MKSIKLLVAVISGSFVITPAFCAPQGTPAASLPVLVDFYTEADYGGTKYYAASGLYSTCLGVPADLGTVVKSIKLRPNVKKCTLFDDTSCNKVKGKYKVYSKDQPNVTLSPVWSIECGKKGNRRCPLGWKRISSQFLDSFSHWNWDCYFCYES